MMDPTKHVEHNELTVEYATLAKNRWNDALQATSPRRALFALFGMQVILSKGGHTVDDIGLNKEEVRLLYASNLELRAKELLKMAENDPENKDFYSDEARKLVEQAQRSMRESL